MKLGIGKEQRLSESACTACGHSLDGAAAAMTEEDTRESPQPGDALVCVYCGHIMAFSENLTMRDLTDEEMVQIAGDPVLLEVQRMSAAFRKEKDRK